MLAAKYLIIIGVAGLGTLAGVVLENRDKIAWFGTPPARSADMRGTYLSPAELPDSLKLIPPPPAAGSAAMQADEAARQRALALKGTLRYALAKSDAARDSARTINSFSCAFGTEISEANTPTLYGLLVRVRIDARRASYRAKNHYMRPQPFVIYHTKTCSPAEEELTAPEGSYPAARSAVGWAYALVLANLNPARAKEIMERGRQFGQSRVICDVQWQSDVDAGYTVGAATVSALSKNKAFRADLAASRAEIASARGAPTNCAAESKALASR
jgi:acid phosphatase (class A)